MNKEEVLKLANLSRLELTDQELEQYSQEMSSILGFVETINSALSDSDDSMNIIESAGERNIFREDTNSDETGKNTKDILACAPDVKDDFIKVQKILNTENGSH